MTNLHGSIEVISLADASYDTLVRDQMQNSGYLEIPFKQWYCQNEPFTGGVARFQVSTQSLDRVWIGFRYNGIAVKTAEDLGRQYPHTAQGPPVPVLGYAPSAAMETRSETSERYTTAQQCFRTPGLDGLQWQLNGAMIPQTYVPPSELMSFTKDQLPSEEYIRDDLTAAEYLSSSFVGCLRLNMRDSGSRLVSGLDTRSANLQGVVRSTGGNPNSYDAFIALETTATLRVMPGRAVAVIS